MSRPKQFKKLDGLPAASNDSNPDDDYMSVAHSDLPAEVRLPFVIVA